MNLNNLIVKDCMIDINSSPVVKSQQILKEAINQMETHKIGIVNVIDENFKLIGVITDGDLRRMINNRIDLTSTPIKEVMTKNFKFVNDVDLVLDVSRIMEDQKIYSLIVKNSNKKITGLIRMHEILSAKII